MTSTSIFSRSAAAQQTQEMMMKNLITKDSVDIATMTEGAPTNIADIVANFKRSVGDLSLYDDVVFEADVEQQGARAKTHLRLRAYRRSDG